MSALTDNILLGWRDRIAGATLSAGSWRAALPLSNVATTQYPQVARSTNAALASTKFQADFGAARVLRVVALCNHNLSQASVWRVSLGTTAGGSDVYAGTWMPVWRMSWDNELLQWESPSWWAGTGPDEYTGHPYPALCVLPDWYSARYLTVELDDTSNPDGYVQIGRALACNAFQPACNAAYGIRDGWTDLSTSSRADSGALWVAARRRLRTVQFQLDQLSQAEGDTLHEMMRSAGTIGEVLYVPLPSDPGVAQRYGFAGTLAELSMLDYPSWATRALPVRLQEIV